MHTISGTVLSTNKQWLPYLANIEPPYIRRQNSVLKEKDKIDKHQELPIHKDGIVNPRLKSRKPFLLRTQIITEARDNTPDAWQTEWQRERFGGIQVDNVRTPVLGTDLPRKIWVRLNRIRTEQGRCNELMHRWKFRESPMCDCGTNIQSMQHLILDCQLRSYDGDLEDFIKMTPEAVAWLESLDVDT